MLCSSNWTLKPLRRIEEHKQSKILLMLGSRHQKTVAVDNMVSFKMVSLHLFEETVHCLHLCQLFLIILHCFHVWWPTSGEWLLGNLASLDFYCKPVIRLTKWKWKCSVCFINQHIMQDAKEKWLVYKQWLEWNLDWTQVKLALQARLVVLVEIKLFEMSYLNFFFKEK